MRFFLMILLSTALAPPVLADAPVCEVNGPEVVEHARKRGYRFEATPEDRCEWNPSRAIFIASAAATSALECNVRIFAKTPVAPAAPPPGAAAAPDAAGPAAPASSGWAIASILIVVTNSTSPNPAFYPSRDPDDVVNGGWRFLARAAAAEVVQYRIDKIEFTTEKDCKLWKDAF